MRPSPVILLWLPRNASVFPKPVCRASFPRHRRARSAWPDKPRRRASSAARVLRCSLFVVACLATLIALAYAVENWRGKQVWEKQKRSLEAKGELLDWAAYIPAPVPDEQNSFKAPRIT